MGFSMQTIGLIIEDLDGLHEDGWCPRLVRGRLRATSAASQLEAQIWIRSEMDRTGNCSASISAENLPPTVAEIPRDMPTTLTCPVDLNPGDELSFRIFCDNRMVHVGADARELSFVLLGLTVR